jgi:glycosyltransferase involved in cell wall biosynthesis
MQHTATIVIPTLNGAGRIRQTLAALAAQETPPGAFEVVIVDNGSEEASRVTDTHPSVLILRRRGIACRVVNEERRGLVFARIKGVLEARSPLVCFLDDDNVPASPRYVANGVEAFSDPATGLLVSRVFPRYEAQPTPSIKRREHLLAVNHRLGDSVIEWGSDTAFAPTQGAGMWVRRELFLSLVPWRQPEKMLSDRKGKQLTSGGDIEIGFMFGRAGHKRVYRPELRVWHLIPASRFKAAYFVRLIVGIVRSQHTLDARYAGQPYNLRRRTVTLLRLFGVALATPLLLLRRDGLRETLFVMASRCASIAGPYAEYPGGAGQRNEAADLRRGNELAPRVGSNSGA